MVKNRNSKKNNSKKPSVARFIVRAKTYQTYGKMSLRRGEVKWVDHLRREV